MQTAPPSKSNLVIKVKNIPIEMVYVEAGSYEMGYGQYKDTLAIEIEKGFYLSKYLVTNALWTAVMGQPNEHSRFTGDQQPVEGVSWLDIGEQGGFLDKLNSIKEVDELNKSDGKQFRLPSETQWEYAARGGKKWLEHPYVYAGSNHLKEVGWYDGNSHRETQPVGLKLPNSLGLYDMSGNLWEWCEDVWTENRSEIPKDGSPNQKGGRYIRVVRGGSWYDYDLNCRVSGRFRNFDNYRINYIGFRLCRY